MNKTKWDRGRTDIREPVNVGKLLFGIWMKGVACFGFDTRIYISNVLARLSPFLRFDPRLRGISNEWPWSGSKTISLLRSKWNCFKKKKKRGKKKRKNAHVIRTHRGGNDNCTVRTSMDEEHEVDFKVSLSKMLLTFLLKFTSNLISLSHDW